MEQRIRKFIRVFILALGAIILSFPFISSITTTIGSPGGKTGSPADVNNCTQCHTGIAQNISNWISSDIPSAGYVPGQKYSITLNAYHGGAPKMGFECTAENAQNQKSGSFLIIDNANTKLVNNNKAVTHTGNGVLTTNWSRSWSFDFIAPAKNSGTITFYAAVNAANGNMGTSGDVIYLTQLSVNEDITASVEGFEKRDGINIYPNPFIENIEIVNMEEVNTIEIFDIKGSLQVKVNVNRKAEMSLNLSALKPGVYWLRLGGSVNVEVFKIIKTANEY